MIALSIEAVNFVRHGALYLTMPIVGDSTYFFSMGRAWLNGLVLYRDLFESKPPGVFLVAAASLRLSGGNALYLWMQFLLLAPLGPAVAIVTYRALNKTPRSTRWYSTAIGLLLGLTMAVQTLHRTAGNEAEGFALLFALLPALLLALSISDRRHDVVLDILAGASLAVATMLKEPFGPASVLAMLIFCSSRRDGFRIVRTLIFGGLACLAILALSGSFNSYFSIYLPEMIQGRAVGNVAYTYYGQQEQQRFLIPTPLWARSLDSYRMFDDLAAPRAGIFLAAFFLACVSVWAPMRANDARPRQLLASCAIIAVALFAAHNAFLLHQLVSGLHATGNTVPWNNAIILRLLALAIGLPSAAVTGLAILSRRGLISWRICSIAAFAFLVVVMTSGLVTYGGVYDQPRYLVFAFPPLVALAVYCITATARSRQPALLVLLSLPLILNAVMPGRYDYSAISEGLRSDTQKAGWQEGAAEVFDALLLKCNFERYALGDSGLDALAAYTHHSPYQIRWGMFRSFVGLDDRLSSQLPNSYLAEKMTVDLRRTPVIVLSAKGSRASIRPEIRQLIQADFTASVPSCAKPFLPISGLSVFFRDRAP